MARRNRIIRSLLVIPFLVGCLTSHEVTAQDLDAVIELYETGDFAAALDGFVALATEGDAIAQHYLALMYIHGQGVPQNDAEAVKWLRLAAKQERAGALILLGIMYHEGQGVPQSDAEAAKLYRLAAEQGDDRGQAFLGMMYARGLGVAQNDTEAVKWLRLAAEQGHAMALLMLGSMYQEGRGIPQNEAEATRLYRLVAEQAERGLAEAQFVLGVMFYLGAGVSQDLVSAYAWFSVSSANSPWAYVKDLRDEMATTMTTAQIAEAQELFVEYWNHHVVPFQ